MISSSLSQTMEAARLFASLLQGGDVVFLEGDLGVGKTTFVQDVLSTFGVAEPVRSPTFSLMNVYPVHHHPTIKKVIHADFYRFEDPSEVRALGFEELLEEPNTLFFIEWPSKGIDGISPIHPTRTVRFTLLPSGDRQIDF